MVTYGTFSKKEDRRSQKPSGGLLFSSREAFILCWPKKRPLKETTGKRLPTGGSPYHQTVIDCSKTVGGGKIRGTGVKSQPALQNPRGPRIGQPALSRPLRLPRYPSPLIFTLMPGRTFCPPSTMTRSPGFKPESTCHESPTVRPTSTSLTSTLPPPSTRSTEACPSDRAAAPAAGPARRFRPRPRR